MKILINHVLPLGVCLGGCFSGQAGAAPEAIHDDETSYAIYQAALTDLPSAILANWDSLLGVRVDSVSSTDLLLFPDAWDATHQKKSPLARYWLSSVIGQRLAGGVWQGNNTIGSDSFTGFGV